MEKIILKLSKNSQIRYIFDAEKSVHIGKGWGFRPWLSSTLPLPPLPLGLLRYDFSDFLYPYFFYQFIKTLIDGVCLAARTYAKICNLVTISDRPSALVTIKFHEIEALFCKILLCGEKLGYDIT